MLTVSVFAVALILRLVYLFEISGTPLTEQKLVDNEFCACQNCGGFLVSSKLIDNKLPEKSNARPMQQLDGPVSFIEILGLLSPWW